MHWKCVPPKFVVDQTMILRLNNPGHSRIIIMFSNASLHFHPLLWQVVCRWFGIPRFFSLYISLCLPPGLLVGSNLG